MLCLEVAALPEGDEWLYELKWDGYRAIAAREPGGWHLYSRNGKSFDRDFADLLHELAQLKCKSAVLDGEVVAFSEEGKPSFQLLQKRTAKRNLTFVVFDLIMLDGRDLRSISLLERRKALSKILPKIRGGVTLSPELIGSPEQLLEQARALQLEGIVAKRRSSKYEPNERSGAWVKRRAELAGTFVIGGYVPGTHGFDELLLGEVKGRRVYYIGHLRAGFVPATRRSVMSAIKPHIQDACPFVNLPESGKGRWGKALDAEEMKKCRWLRPKVKAEVDFVERTESGKLRHPKFVRLS
jgi:bifunctional non-homologous end joining protein LigD